MREEVLSVLRCPKCRAKLDVDKALHEKGEIRSGELICRGEVCHRYDIEHGIVRFATGFSVDAVRKEIDYSRNTFTVGPLLRDPAHVANYPDTLGKVWPHVAHFGPDFRSAIQALGIQEGSWVVDVGTGTCWSSRLLAQTGARVIAMDVIDTPFNGLGTADIQFDAHHVYFERVLESMTVFPFESESIDFIIFNASYHHTSDEHQTLEECYRVIKPGGTILMLQEFTSLARRLRPGYEEVGSEQGSSHHDISFSVMRSHARRLGLTVQISPSEHLRQRAFRRLGGFISNWCISLLVRHEWLLRPLSLACVSLHKPEPVDSTSCKA